MFFPFQILPEDKRLLSNYQYRSPETVSLKIGVFSNRSVNHQSLINNGEFLPIKNVTAKNR